MLAALAERRPVEHGVALVVAHPDDETIALGGSMHLFRRLLLVQVTDGAPRRLGDAARAGFESPADYAAARAAELDAALSCSGAAPIRVTLGIADQDATAAMPEITDRLRSLLDEYDISEILTHAYEGGHPDHDAVALAAHRTGAGVVEFAGYHAGPGGEMRTGRFLSAEHGSGETVVRLSAADYRTKRAMLDCFRTQHDILSHFDPSVERFRPAPAYDFAKPPHPGELLYEQWGWMSGTEWRKCAA